MKLSYLCFILDPENYCLKINSVIQTDHAGLLSDCGNKEIHMPSSVLLTDNLELE